MSEIVSVATASEHNSALAAPVPAKHLQLPVYVDLLPPCNITCPAGENIQEWMGLVQVGRYEEAWRALVRNNPFPAIHGRVCYHPCENGCNRKRLEQPVSIHAVERFLGDMAVREGWSIPAGKPTGKRVLVVGSGPGGLSAAYHLALLGHEVTVHESSAKLGGMMRYAIPEYRLPRDVLDVEIGRIARMGVKFQTNTKTENLEAFVKEQRFDAVYLAFGAQNSKRINISAADPSRIVDALEFLHDAAEGQASACAGRRVAIYGGGNTAMDAARTALRLGAREAFIVYRRNQARMPAHHSELEEALLEGVAVHWLRTIKQFDENVLQVEIMELDAKGNPQATGQFETLPADMLILALGQETESEFLKDVPGIVVRDSGEIEVSGSMMTGHRGIFAGGDMIPANKTVTTAVGHGKKAARNIDAYLQNQTYTPARKHAPARYDRLHTEFYRSASQVAQPVLTTAVRLQSFAETVGGLDEASAIQEAGRCMSCGNCNECDACYSVCPEHAIMKLGPGQRYQINAAYCNGCGLCVENCPAGAIDLVTRSIEMGATHAATPPVTRDVLCAPVAKVSVVETALQTTMLAKPESNTAPSDSAATVRWGMTPAETRAAPSDFWDKCGLPELIDQIEANYHSHLKKELPRLERSLERLAKKHGQEFPELVKLHELLGQFKADLIVHMFKEEHVLFVLCRRLSEAANSPLTRAGSVRRPVEAMMLEHDLASSDLAQMRQLTNGFTPPAKARKAHRTILASLAALDVQMQAHMKNENEILFPRALAAEAELEKRASVPPSVAL